MWSGGRSQVLRLWYLFCVCWCACRFLWTALAWDVWEERREKLDLSWLEYRSLAGEGRLLSMGVVHRHSRGRSGSVLLCLTLSMVSGFLEHGVQQIHWTGGIWRSLWCAESPSPLQMFWTLCSRTAACYQRAVFVVCHALQTAVSVLILLWRWWSWMSDVRRRASLSSSQQRGCNHSHRSRRYL